MGKHTTPSTLNSCGYFGVRAFASNCIVCSMFHPQTQRSLPKKHTKQFDEQTHTHMLSPRQREVHLTTPFNVLTVGRGFMLRSGLGLGP